MFIPANVNAIRDKSAMNDGFDANYTITKLINILSTE